MTWRVILLVAGVVMMSLSGLVNTLVFLQMEDEINRRRGHSGHAGLFRLARTFEICREYRQLFPQGRLFLALMWTIGIGLGSGLCAAYLLFFGLSQYALPSR